MLGLGMRIVDDLQGARHDGGEGRNLPNVLEKTLVLAAHRPVQRDHQEIIVHGTSLPFHTPQGSSPAQFLGQSIDLDS